MAAPIFPRPLIVTVFTGSAVLFAVYYARHFREWDAGTRATVAAGFLAIAGVLVFADWWVRRNEGPRKRSR